MTNSPQVPARASRPPAPSLDSQAPAAAVSYVPGGAASLIADDRDTASAGLLEGGAEAACAMHDLPGHAAPAIFRRAASCLARASGYQPLDPGDPVTGRARRQGEEGHERSEKHRVIQQRIDPRQLRRQPQHLLRQQGLPQRHRIAYGA